MWTLCSIWRLCWMNSTSSCGINIFSLELCLHFEEECQRCTLPVTRQRIWRTWREKLVSKRISSEATWTGSRAEGSHQSEKFRVRHFQINCRRLTIDAQSNVNFPALPRLVKNNNSIFGLLLTISKRRICLYKSVQFQLSGAQNEKIRIYSSSSKKPIETK